MHVNNAVLEEAKKAEAGLLLLDKADVMHVNDGLEEDRGVEFSAAP